MPEDYPYDKPDDFERQQLWKEDIASEEIHKKALTRETLRITNDEKKIFKDVDRDEEDRLVKEYQRTGDQGILGRLYAMREPTLWAWARKFSWLDDPKDMFSEFCMVWLNCVNRYDSEAKLRPVRNKDGSIQTDEKTGKAKMDVRRTTFNTYSFTAFRNKSYNIIKKKMTRKRSDGCGDPVFQSMRSLDISQEDERNLHDKLCDDSHKMIMSNVSCSDLIKAISQGDTEIAKVLQQYVDQPYFKNLAVACKVRKSILKISNHDHSILVKGGKVGTAHLEGMISSTGAMKKNFKVVSYTVDSGSVEFQVLMHNTRMSRKVMDAVKAYRETEGVFR
jgi:hypothetical protein